MLAGLVSIFFKAAFQAYIPLLLQKDELVDGNSKLQASTAFASVGGPGIGGAVAQFLGVATGVILDAASFAVSAICLLATPANEPELKSSRPKRELGQEIRDGLRFLLHDPYLLPLAAFTAILGLGISSTDSLMIVFYVRTIGITSGTNRRNIGPAGRRRPFRRRYLGTRCSEIRQRPRNADMPDPASLPHFYSRSPLVARA